MWCFVMSVLYSCRSIYRARVMYNRASCLKISSKFDPIIYHAMPKPVNYRAMLRVSSLDLAHFDISSRKCNIAIEGCGIHEVEVA